MELNYNITLRQEQNKNLKNNLKTVSSKLSINSYRFNNTIMLKSNSNNISNYFERTSDLARNTKLKDNFLLGYENLDAKGYFEDLVVDDSFIRSLNTSKYNSKLIPITNFDYDIDIETDKIYLIIYNINTNTFSLLEKEYYEIDYSNKNTTIFDRDDLNYKYFFLIDREVVRYKKAESLYTVEKEDLLKLSSGFYEIFPSYKKNNFKFNITTRNEKLSIISEEVLTLESNLYINFDNCHTDLFYYIPSFPLEISYSSNDLTPLYNISEFDINKEYIIFELKNNIQVPKYFLSSENDISDNNETFNLLLQSHREFKKPFSVICNESIIKVFNSENSLISTETIKNKDFNIIKTDEAFKETLIKIKI